MRGERIIRSRSWCALAVFLLIANANIAFGATIFYDDFSDGDTQDGVPVSWSSGIVQDDDLLLKSRPGSYGSWASARTPQGGRFELHDTSVRAQVRIPEGSKAEYIAIAIRDEGSPEPNYDARLGRRETVWLYADNIGPPTLLGRAPVPFNVFEEDVVLQFDAFGPELSVWAWRAGDPMPEQPQITATDDRLEWGTVLLCTWNSSQVTEAVGIVRYVHVADTPIRDLQPGDADQDSDFDQLDLVQVQQAGKYLTSQVATWGEGDWNGAPGGSPGYAPLGDGVFNQLDIVAAQQAAKYLTGSYAANVPVAVPEPSSLVLLGVGLLAFGAWAQRHPDRSFGKHRHQRHGMGRGN